MPRGNYPPPPAAPPPTSGLKPPFKGAFGKSPTGVRAAKLLAALAGGGAALTAVHKALTTPAKGVARLGKGTKSLLEARAAQQPQVHPLLQRAATIPVKRLAQVGAAGAAAGALYGFVHGGGYREPDLFPKRSSGLRRLLYEVPETNFGEEDDPDGELTQTLGLEYRTRRHPFAEAAPGIGGVGAAGVSTLLSRGAPRVPRAALALTAGLLGAAVGAEARRRSPRTERITALLNGTTAPEAVSALKVATGQMSPAAYQTLHGAYPSNFRVTTP